MKLFKKILAYVGAFALLFFAIGLCAFSTATVGLLPDGGPTLPATCNVGQIYFKTTATIGLNQCTSLNTWVAFPTGSGITNSAGANVIPKSDGTNIVASSLSDNGTNVTSAEAFLSPIGSNTLPSYSFTGHTATGLSYNTNAGGGVAGLTVPDGNLNIGPPEAGTGITYARMQFTTNVRTGMFALGNTENAFLFQPPSGGVWFDLTPTAKVAGGVMDAQSYTIRGLAMSATLTADWTCGTGGTVSSCTAATIIGSNGGVPLTFTFPSVAASWTWECDLVVGQATAATANSWNFITATNAPTNMMASYQMNTGAAATAGGATVAISATTTTVIGGAWTLGGTGTKMPVHIYGRVEGASASGTVLSLQLVAPTVADLVTIYRGSGCKVRT